ncbi:MAG: M23 family metallopeptidase [Candidatus Thiodiazotropha sp. (ex Epidulcina cf. delphinae)]|nr:M23 family metallopeptidase [Candidatus Thiodiazotropha sp. (ex Epidulcina cf. delphinae)]
MKTLAKQVTARKFNRLLIFVLWQFLFIACGGGGGGDNDTDDGSGGDTPADTNTQSSTFDYPPVDLSKVEFILPLGGMIGNHVTPIDHQYYVAPDFGAAESIEIDVYSPADGTVSSIQHMGNFSHDDYRLVVDHSATIQSIYIHVDNLSAKLAAEAPQNGQYVNTDIAVSAGEVLGNYSGSVDYNLVDNDITLSGFINPGSYTAEPWKIHTPDPFEYFNTTIRQTLLAKSLRTAEPMGGKIDHDIDGRLVGNWFLENSNGYAGLDPSHYWLGHLSFSYDYIVPDHIIASFGDYAGQQKQFGILGNAPDPADVSVSSGLVKYDLVAYEYYDGGIPWDRVSFAQGLTMDNYAFIDAVVLVQLVGERRLKVEIFHGQTSTGVNSFTASAQYYVR